MTSPIPLARNALSSRLAAKAPIPSSLTTSGSSPFALSSFLLLRITRPFQYHPNLPARSCPLQPPGTHENPVQVTSSFTSRIVGAPDPDDDMIVYWGEVKEGDGPTRIGDEFFVSAPTRLSLHLPLIQ